MRALHLRNVILVESGVGPANARRTISEAVSGRSVGGIIQIGFAGALSQSLQLGDVVLASAVEGKGAGPVSPEYARRAAKVLSGDIRWHVGTYVTHDKIIAASEEKRRIAEIRPDDEIACVDMESAPVTSICIERRIPYLGLRAITDTLDDNLPLELDDCRNRDGNIDSMRVMWAAVHNPGSIAGLMDLRRRARECARSLATCVRDIVTAYPTPERLTSADAS